MKLRWPIWLFGLVLAWAGCDSGQRTVVSSPVVATHGISNAAANADPLADAITSKAVVLIFVTTDCPISNRYAPEVNRLCQKYASHGVRFWRVYSDKTATPEALQKHGEEYAYAMPGTLDPKHRLADRAKVEITPEAAVFSPRGELLYHGRIDDRYVSFGKARPEPTKRDLEEVLTEILAGRPVTNLHQKAIGCYIPRET